MSETAEIAITQAHAAMAYVLKGLEEDHRMGRSHTHPDIHLDFTTPDGRDLQEADLEAPGEGEEYMGRAGLVVALDGRPLGSVAVTALAPGQGTGGTSTFKPDELARPDWLPDTPGVIPVSREGVFAELHLPVATLTPIGHDSARMHRLVNHLMLLGLSDDGRNIVSLGSVGQSANFFRGKLDGRTPGSPHPQFTQTTGYGRERSGEHTALFNPTEAVQVAATIAIRDPNPADVAFLRDVMVGRPMNVPPEAMAAGAGQTA